MIRYTIFGAPWEPHSRNDPELMFWAFDTFRIADFRDIVKVARMRQSRWVDAQWLSWQYIKRPRNRVPFQRF